VGVRGTATEAGGKRELLTAADLARAIARIAHQITEKTELEPARAEELVLLCLPTRGAHVAEFTGTAVRTGTRDPTLYRDDLRRRPTRALEPTMLPPGGVDDRLVVLVDDVLYSGRTVRGALDALRNHGRPRAVQLAVLVDRGHRELPIRAGYVGKNVSTSRAEEVAVLMSEVDGRDAVLMRRVLEAVQR
jgi:pyrimidine operon attenuation protein/uracil phosphoribosyltransferase